jgi:hypothetical protein
MGQGGKGPGCVRENACGGGLWVHTHRCVYKKAGSQQLHVRLPSDSFAGPMEVGEGVGCVVWRGVVWCRAVCIVEQ